MKTYQYIFLVCSMTIMGMSMLWAQDAPNSASEAYRKGNFKKSIQLYDSLRTTNLAQHNESATLYYNLGNAYFRDNQIAQAILNYERALLLKPGDSDIRHNLRFARLRIEDRFENADNFFLSNWFRGLQNIFSANAWARTAIVLFIVFLICVALFLFVRAIWLRKTAFYIGITVLFFVLVANVFAFNQKNARIHHQSAIVMAAAATGYSSPDANSKEIFELHAGTKVKLKKSDGNWFEIELPDGNVGWMKKEKMEII